MKIQIIIPPKNIGGVGVSGCMVPTGVLSLADHLTHNHPVDVEVLDGTIIPYADIISRLDAEIVGISALAGNYRAGKKILQAAKKKGAKTIVGNHHARFLFNETRSDHAFAKLFPEIDLIVESQYAEQTLSRVLTEPVSTVPSLGFRQEDGFVINSTENSQKTAYDLKDLLRHLEHRDKYTRNYQQLYRQWHGNEIKLFNTALITGCLQGIKNPCAYCCLIDHKISKPTEEKFWQEMQFLADEGYNYVFETCNSLTSLSKIGQSSARGSFLHRLAKSRPRNIPLELMVYGKADEVTDEVIEDLKEMGVHRLILGLDSYSSTLQKGIGKFVSPEQNRSVVHRLNDAGIQIFGCFVPGARGETEETLQQTNEFIEQIMELPQVSTIEYTALAPLPGSRAWEEIKHKYWIEHGKSDVIDIADLARSYLKTYTQVKWDSVQKSQKSIQEIAEKKGIVFGGYY